jgi:adenylate cyclase
VLAADVRYCTACGAPRPVACSGCGRVAGPVDRFCGDCGQSLGGAVAAPTVAPPSPAPPSPAPAAPATDGERKQVTVLFADVAGSMDLAEGVDPEDWAGSMDRFFRILSEGVVRFGGTVDKFTGDGIMALFGAPLSQEDHARRACHAALRLREATAGLEFKVRIGLNSGEVVAGGIGSGGRLEYTALGHTVGLAQRMEALAEPGSVLLTGHTARLVRNDFTLRDLGPQTIKGSSGPVAVYRLEGARRRTGTGGSSAMVGRSEEMAILEAALARAQEGQAQVIGVVGEAGVGKSRLCDEFCRSAVARGITVRRAAGVSHARDVPLLPVLEFLRDYFGISETDSRAGAREKIAARILDLDPGLDDTLPLMFDLLEVPDPERPTPRLAPDVRQERIFGVIRRITQRRSSRQTIVFLWEDLHWFDAQSLAFVERLIHSFPGSRTLVLTNFRPEFVPPWAAHSYYRQLPLGPLDPGAVGHLLLALVGHDVSLSAFAELVTETTAGSPFFVEEVIRSLVEDGTLTGEPGAYRLTRPVVNLAVPPTVQATLAARIDRLDERDKAVLQTAAVIGRLFTEPVLRRASGLRSDDAATSLGRLCRSEFLQVVSDNSLDEYRFWHPLTQEVAYGSLLRERRAGLHRAVAEAIIATDADRHDERAAIVANHFEQAGDALEAGRWHHRAGDFALRGDLAEADRRWRRAADHLRAVPESDEAGRILVRALTRLIRYGARTGADEDERSGFYGEATAIADRLGDAVGMATLTFAHASNKLWAGAIAEAHDVYRRAWSIAVESGDPASQAAMAAGVGFTATWVGPVTAAFEFFDEIERRCGGDPGFGSAMLGYGLLGPAYFIRARGLALLGRFAEAHDELQRAEAIVADRRETEWLAWVRSEGFRHARTEPEMAAALESARMGVADAEASGNPASLAIALGGLGQAEVGLRRFGDAVGHLEQAFAIVRRHRTAGFDEPWILAALAEARLGVRDCTSAREAADEAVAVARRQGAGISECMARLARVRVTSATGGPDTGREADLATVIALAGDLGATAYEAEAAALRAGTPADPM